MFEEATILRAAYAYEQAAGWWTAEALPPTSAGATSAAQ
jgi:Asp-tRNA(Asn)/Glu-tRNA(Gln) amidotransferase A subunit family amidase